MNNLKVNDYRKRYKTIWIIIILIILMIGGIFTFNIISFNNNPNVKSLRSLKYSDQTIRKILKTDDIKAIIEHKTYEKTLDLMINSKYYNAKRLNLYLTLDYNSTYKDSITFVNDLNYFIDHKFTDEEIINVFKNDQTIINNIKNDKTDTLHAYLSQPGFKYFKYNDYLTYASTHKDLLEQEVIRNINLHLDQPFYEYVIDVKDYDKTTVLVNKYYKLPNTYEPKDLVVIGSNYADGILSIRKVVLDSFTKLCDAATKDGYQLKAASTYRSYKEQQSVYNDFLTAYGKITADKKAARPGHSEHQTGLAIDVESLNGNIFSQTKEYTWLIANAHKYGFIMRYEKNNEEYTGYSSEPWHIRYVGNEIAEYIYKTGMTYDEYYSLFIEK